MRVAQDSREFRAAAGSSGEALRASQEKTLELTLKGRMGAWQKDEWERIFQIGRNARVKMQS